MTASTSRSSSIVPQHSRCKKLQFPPDTKDSPLPHCRSPSPMVVASLFWSWLREERGRRKKWWRKKERWFGPIFFVNVLKGHVMAYHHFLSNCNDMSPNRQIVMIVFKIKEVAMSCIQLTLKQRIESYPFLSNFYVMDNLEILRNGSKSSNILEIFIQVYFFIQLLSAVYSNNHSYIILVFCKTDSYKVLQSSTWNSYSC